MEIDEVDLLPPRMGATVVDRWSISSAPEESRSPALAWWPVARVGLGERVVGGGLAKEILDAWLSTEFEGGRHQRRVNKIHDIESRD